MEQMIFKKGNVFFEGEKFPYKLELDEHTDNYILGIYHEDIDEWEVLAEIYEIVIKGKKYWTFANVFVSLTGLNNWYDFKYKSVEEMVLAYLEFVNKNY